MTCSRSPEVVSGRKGLNDSKFVTLHVGFAALDNVSSRSPYLSFLCAA